ncbi:MAG: hypothetical protein ACFFB2_20350 [Promethearchaeota archaeon]
MSLYSLNLRETVVLTMISENYFDLLISSTVPIAIIVYLSRKEDAFLIGETDITEVLTGTLY